LTEYPQTDAQQLRQLIRNAKKALPGAERAVFQFLKKEI